MPSMGTDPRRLDGLRSDERAAALLVEQATGATARAHDVAGRQAAYDVDLLHADGRTGALEVTTHAGPARRDRDALLARDLTSWPNPGRWWWALDLADPDELPRLRAAYGRAIEMCEAHGLASPAALPATAKAADPEVAWLADSARSRLVGRHPVSPEPEAAAGDREPRGRSDVTWTWGWASWVCRARSPTSWWSRTWRDEQPRWQRSRGSTSDTCSSAWVWAPCPRRSTWRSAGRPGPCPPRTLTCPRG